MLSSVLLVDDDHITNFVNKGVVSKLKISQDIHVAFDGDNGIRVIKQLCEEGCCCPELIFLDINMPGSDGFDFLRKFNSKHFTHKELTVVVVLTTSAHPEDLQKVLELGVNEILQKPLTGEKLKCVYDKYFARRSN